MSIETWGPTVLESLVALFLFSLGFPALLAQLVAVKEDVRDIVLAQLFRLVVLLALFFSLGIGGLLWLASDQAAVADHYVVAYGEILLVAATGLTAAVCAKYSSSLSRKGLIGQVRAAFTRSQEKGLKRHRSAERALALLGAGSSAGAETADMLKTLSILLHAEISKPAYDGTRCAGLLRAVRRTLLTPGNIGNEENFRMGAQILVEKRKLILEVQRGKFGISSDFGWLSDLMADLACSAASEGFQASEELLEYLPSEKLLEVGVAAWRAQRVPTYTNAANKLSTRHEAARRAGEPHDDLATCYLALLAHLRTGGSAARYWSDQRLEELREELGAVQLREAVGRAWKDRFSVGDFESADALQALRELPPVEPLPPRPRKQERRKTR